MIAKVTTHHHVGLEEVPRAQAVERRCSGEEFGVRGDNSQLVRLVLVDRFAARDVDNVDPESGRRSSSVLDWPHKGIAEIRGTQSLARQDECDDPEQER
ncbi:MAG: hypothetical protein P8Y44_13570 [Acidobacteriota bacterium]